jgi:hypothetical protein
MGLYLFGQFGIRLFHFLDLLHDLFKTGLDLIHVSITLWRLPAQVRNS